MKIFIMRKNTLLVAALAIILVAVSMTGAKPASGTGGSALPIYSVETPEKKVAVTFNAAWGAEDIGSILETLQNHDIKCTFFLVGNWAERFPEEAMKIREAGHEIASHGYDHSHYQKLSEAEMRADMEKSEAAIEKATGMKPYLFRAPYGEYNETLVRLCEKMGRFIIQWDVDSLDWKGLSAAEMEARILPRLQNGSVLLFHTGTKQTAASLDGLLQKIRAAGYSFSTVGDLIYKEGYTINHEGRQISKR